MHQNQADNAQGDRDDEHDGIAEGLVQEHSGHGARGEGQVHADTKIADAFATTARRQGVNGHRIARRAGNPEEKPMGKADHRQDGKNAYRLIAQKARGKGEERPKVERLTAEGIHQKSGEGPAGQCPDGVKRDDETCGGVVGLEFFDNVEGQNRQQLVKTEEQQKVRGGHRHEVPGPKRGLACGDFFRIHHLSSTFVPASRWFPGAVCRGTGPGAALHARGSRSVPIL